MSFSEKEYDTLFLNHYHTFQSTEHEDRLRDFTAVNHYGSTFKV